MKRQVLLILLTISCAISYSQITFEKGYFITNENERIECLIKNMDWKNNPTEFEFKLTETSELKITSIKEVKEFGVDPSMKFRRYLVKIDRSSKAFSTLTKSRDPEFSEETVFLKQLIQGKANLYKYEEGSLIRYFYDVNNSEIEQLVHKRYLTEDKEIAENNQYRQQLWANLRCEAINMADINTLSCTKNALIKYFIKYNNCVNSEIINFEKSKGKNLFHVNIRPGINFSSFSMRNDDSDIKEIDFGSQTNFRFGIEAEFVMPYNNNKWAIVLEPTYQYFTSEREVNYLQVYGIIKMTKMTMTYKSIEFPIAVRHYFFLNDKSMLFINVAYVIDLNLNSIIDAENEDLMDYEINSRPNIVFGVGYLHDNRYSVEMKYGLSRNLLGDFLYWDSDYKNFSVILGYRLY